MGIFYDSSEISKRETVHILVLYFMSFGSLWSVLYLYSSSDTYVASELYYFVGVLLKLYRHGGCVVTSAYRSFILYRKSYIYLHFLQ